MSLDNLMMPLNSLEEFKSLINSIREGIGVVEAHGLSDVQKALVITALSRVTNRTCLIITHNDALAGKFYEDISFFDSDSTVYLPSSEMVFHRIDAKSNDIRVSRIKALSKLGSRLIVCASLEGVLPKLSEPDFFNSKFKNVCVGDVMPIKEFTEYFVEVGYERVEMIEGRGQFSLRGGIIDFFLPTEDYPVRIELFDDEIDSIRYFDLNNQRSIKKLDNIRLSPMRELLISKKDFKTGAERLDKSLKKRLNLLKNKKRATMATLEDRIKTDVEKLKQNFYFEGIETYYSFFAEKSYSIIDYLENPIIIIDEPNRVRQRHDNINLEVLEHFKSLLEDGLVLPEQIAAQFSYDDILAKMEPCQILCFNALLKSLWDFKPKKIISFVTRSMQPFHGKISLLADDLKFFKKHNYKVLVLAGGKERGQRLTSELWDAGIEAIFREKLNFELANGQIVIMPGNISGGFEIPAIKYAIITDIELSGAPRKKTLRKKGSRVKFFGDLKTGDYIVHEHHGIGQYMGIEQLKVNNIIKDYLQIRYRGNDKLYIPTDQFDLIQKYVGGEKAPKVNRLSGVEWAKTKAKAKSAILDLAVELLKLYAERKNMKGFAFSADTFWQKEFEDLFPYNETPGQLSSLEEIKSDMENEKAMDRLLCGDVGYGKTEVALRAAFKAIMEGKQACILVPTTILAQQHYNTCIQRFEEFPIEVGLLSRFRSTSEQKRTIRGLNDGTVDLVIGTHRLLQKDIGFKELGLLVVDEEQRFGVTHKEKIKRLKKNVDVLTLTATPIPRTLHMSLIGIRDISVIEEPPEDRYPVMTYVMEFNEEVVRDVIIKEIGRGGQVYFLYNRVRTIEKITENLRSLVPEAKIAVGHGQMDEKILENTMLDFFNGVFNVLVCTTIIESGLDIPNVNTIIVYDADKLGLSQLYQLRGRVGRSNRLAYAYLTYQKDKVLTEPAEKRLQAIKEFTEFGSGYKIAMRDLEIRGAGNLLGREQHGHMEAIGYDLYTKLLEDAVKQLTGKPIEEKTETSIELNIEGYIPTSYIKDENQKIEIYKKIAAIDSKEYLYDIEEEVEDRFGDIPIRVRDLLNVAYIKYLASKCGIVSVVQKDKVVLLKLKNSGQLDVMTISKVIVKFGESLTFNGSEEPYFTLKMKSDNPSIYLNNIMEFLEYTLDLKEKHKEEIGSYERGKGQ